VSVEEYAEVTITVGEHDVTGDVVFRETNFQVVAAAQPGSCQVTLRGLHSFMPGRDLICLYINGKRMWWGYLFILEQGFVFPDDPEPRVILHGVDLNILLDKLVLYNRAHPEQYPDGSIPNATWAALTGKAIGTDGYQVEHVEVEDSKVTGHLISVPPETMDRDYIQKMLRDFDLDLVQPLIKWGQPGIAPHETRIEEISYINTGTTDNTWTPPSSGTTLRAFFQDVSTNIIRSQPGSAIWYIDPEGYIVWRAQDFEKGPMVGDAPGAYLTRNLTVTTDVSRLKNDVLVFTGTLDPQPQSTQEFLKFVHKINEESVSLFGRFQWSEVMGSDWLEGMINARAKKVITQEASPAMRADFTVFRSGLYPGQIIEINSSVHTFVTYDPDLGLQTWNSVLMPVRALDMTFPTPNVVEYRATCSYDTQDPWGLLLALKRAPSRGLVQPNFNVIDRTREPDPGEQLAYITASGMIHVKEWPSRMSGGRWQCTYAYIRNSLNVFFIDPTDGLGRRMTNVPEPDSGIMGFIEPDDGPEKGYFMTEGQTRVWCEYHVWHNLNENSI